jgi:hypothetical protein
MYVISLQGEAKAYQRLRYWRFIDSSISTKNALLFFYSLLLH